MTPDSDNSSRTAHPGTAANSNSEPAAPTSASVSLRGIIESVKSSISSVDRNYCYTSFNTAHANTMRTFYGAEIHVGDNMLDHVSVLEDREWSKTRYDAALGGEQVHSSFTVGDLDGEHRFLDVSHNPIFDDDGAIVGVAVLSFDVTASRQAERTRGRLNRELRAVSTCHQTIMRADVEQALLDDICRIICEQAGYRLVAICYAVHDRGGAGGPGAGAGGN